MTALRSGAEHIIADHAVSTSTFGNMLLLSLRRISPMRKLSKRELEVARLYVRGKSYKDIGMLLDISPATVRNFLGRIYTKLNINNKVNLISLLASE